MTLLDVFGDLSRKCPANHSNIKGQLFGQISYELQQHNYADIMNHDKWMMRLRVLDWINYHCNLHTSLQSIHPSLFSQSNQHKLMNNVSIRLPMHGPNAAKIKE